MRSIFAKSQIIAARAPLPPVISNGAGRFFLPLHSSEGSACAERNLSSPGAPFLTSLSRVGILVPVFEVRRAFEHFSTVRSNGTNKVIDTRGTFLLSSPVSIESHPCRCSPPTLRDLSVKPFRFPHLTPVFATHPKNPPVTPFLATHPKSLDLKSFVCHTSAKRGGVPPPLLTNPRRGLAISRSAFLRANVSKACSPAPYPLPLRPVILEEHPMQLFTSHEPPACPERSRGVTSLPRTSRGHGSRVTKYV
jgi:hypothetical protein